jgi:peptide/nickel transport system ATP-binding protein
VTEPLLSVDISADYPGKPGALRDVRFDIWPGEILGLIGESGSGKSTVALAVMRLLELKGGRVRGAIRFHGRDLMAAGSAELRRIRGREIGLVLQSPVAALNPALRIERQLREAWRAHGSGRWRAAREPVQQLLARMGLPADDAFLRRYPREVSVGQAQRVVIAMAVMHRPALLVADEPTSALDPVNAAGILDLFRRLNRESGMAMLYVSHDLRSVEELCHRAVELRAGDFGFSRPATANPSRHHDAAALAEADTAEARSLAPAP